MELKKEIAKIVESVDGIQKIAEIIRGQQNEVVHVNAQLESISDLLDGKEASDFMLSFPVVRGIVDLMAEVEKSEKLQEKMHQITTWINAYPLDVFPEPDLKKAHKILKQHGMTLDAISASSMRHVLKGIKEIIEA